MFGTVRISIKLPFAIALIAAVATIVSGVIIALDAGRSLERSAINQLISVNDARKSELSSYLEAIEGDLVVLAESEILKNALNAFSESWHRLENPQRTLQDLYIDNNPYPTGSKDKLNSAKTRSKYNATHARFHPWFRRLLRDRGYYDIFIFDNSGNLLYTVFKERDYATNFADGEWAESALGHAYKEARDDLKEGQVAFFDFEPYGPSHGAAASFMSTPLIVNGELAGVFAVQMPIGRINAIMGKTEGLGATGETFLLGSDGMFRSEARFDKDALLNLKHDQRFLDAITANSSGVLEAPSYNGTLSKQAFTPLDIHGVRWTVVASISKAEIDTDVHDFYRTTAIVTLGISTLAIIIGIAVGRGITNPINLLSHAMRNIARGDYDTSIGSQGRNDEFGAIMRTLQHMKDGLRENQRLQAELNESRHRQLTAQLERDSRRKIDAAREARAEELRVSLEKAQAASKAKSDFLSSMSHEFRTPLNAVLGFAQLLDTDPDEPLSENQKVALSQILTNGQHLLTSVNDILYFALLADQDDEITASSVNLLEIIETSISSIRDLLADNDIKVELETIAPSNQKVMGEHERLVRCISHLLANAIKYNREGGMVTVAAIDAPNGGIRIRVNDTGMGISSDRHDEVFEPFTRLGAENSNIKGYGIGLATTKRLIESMGGHIGFESSPDIGSSFWIDLERPAPVD